VVRSLNRNGLGARGGSLVRRRVLAGLAGAALLAPVSSGAAAEGPRQLSPSQLLRGLIEGGTRVEVCAIFLPEREGVEERDLVEGVGVAAPPDVAAHMIRPNVRFFTF
jgi:hypothetical protein